MHGKSTGSARMRVAGQDQYQQVLLNLIANAMEAMCGVTGPRACQRSFPATRQTLLTQIGHCPAGQIRSPVGLGWKPRIFLLLARNSLLKARITAEPNAAHCAKVFKRLFGGHPVPNTRSAIAV